MHSFWLLVLFRAFSLQRTTGGIVATGTTWSDSNFYKSALKCQSLKVLSGY